MVFIDKITEIFSGKKSKLNVDQVNYKVLLKHEIFIKSKIIKTLFNI